MTIRGFEILQNHATLQGPTYTCCVPLGRLLYFSVPVKPGLVRIKGAITVQCQEQGLHTLSLPLLLSKRMALGLPASPFLPKEITGHYQSTAHAILRAQQTSWDGYVQSLSLKGCGDV